MKQGNYFSSFFTLLALVWFFSPGISAQNNGFDDDPSKIYDAAPPFNIIPVDTTPSASFPYPTVFNWHYSTMTSPWVSGGTVGAMYFNGKYILNTWGFASNPNKWYRYDGGITGPTTFVDSNAYQGSIRDLATDGTFLYGSAASTTIHVMNENGISQGTITSGGGVARAIAYSPDENALFVCDFSNNIGVINAATGALIRTLTGTSALTGKYGMGYSNIPGEGPVLWVWGQGVVADPYNNLWKVNPQTGEVIANYKFGPLPVSGTTISAIAGGANVVQIGGRWILLLNYQNYALAGYDVTEMIGPGPATNPNPVNGANNVDLNADLSWTNPAGATSIEVFFGTSAGSMNSVYNGTPITMWDPGQMNYGTNYYWQVNETDASGTTLGTTWNFTTMLDPNAPVLVVPSDYTNVPGNLTFLGPLYTSARTYQLLIHESLLTSLAGTQINALSWRIPTSSTANWPPADVTVTDYDIYLSGSVTPADRDLTNFSANVVGPQVQVRSGSLFIPAGSYTFGNTPNNWGPEITFNTGYLYNGGHLLVEIRLSGTGNSRSTDALGTSVSGYGTLFSACWGNGMTANSGSQGNFTIVRLTGGVIPVELVSFNASIVNGSVNLNWVTATEANNYGFEIERKSKGQEFIKIGFISGYGTTTEVKSYSFIDNSISAGNLTYRLKQVDFDGTFEYSNEVEVEFAPVVYSLAQNYPNPFNPSTKISFGLASDSKVMLKIFNILGQEITTLVNRNMSAGVHNIEFNASKINSGVYFYQLEAEGIDGTRFSEVKKMILTK